MTSKPSFLDQACYCFPMFFNTVYLIHTSCDQEVIFWLIFWLNLELHAVEKLDVELTRQKYTKREVFEGLRKQLTYFQRQIVNLQAVQADAHWSGFTHGQKEKGCSLLLVLLDGAQNNMMREVLYSFITEILLALPTSSFIFQSCSTYYASEAFLILKKKLNHAVE